ncbi:hypothetical protein HPB51_029513 [Rhipicephalus microplus]|uniref:Uncharacterized protein n=1 Tax=Rhipicephalus microplus TaxID=6941 RepID=A0A9J6CTZ6_RHIMP|nr:hypothetical protein HPB51_029513 [Rhipicephalus microplus]
MLLLLDGTLEDSNSTIVENVTLILIVRNSSARIAPTERKKGYAVHLDLSLEQLSLDVLTMGTLTPLPGIPEAVFKKELNLGASAILRRFIEMEARQVDRREEWSRYTKSLTTAALFVRDASKQGSYNELSRRLSRVGLLRSPDTCHSYQKMPFLQFSLMLPRAFKNRCRKNSRIATLAITFSLIRSEDVRTTLSQKLNRTTLINAVQSMMFLNRNAKECRMMLAETMPLIKLVTTNFKSRLFQSSEFQMSGRKLSCRVSGTHFFLPSWKRTLLNLAR